MSGTKEGGRKTVRTNKERHGEDFYARIGAKGGHNGHTGGFYGNSEFAAICGALGGLRSSRAGIKNGEGKKNKK